jgi:dynein heavy chain 1, cytosolic
LSSVLLLQDTDEEELAYDGESTAASSEASAAGQRGVVAAYSQVASLLTQWQAKVAVPLKPLPRDATNVHSPLFRCLDREVTTGVVLLHRVNEDIRTVLQVCTGDAKLTNDIRSLLHDLSKDVVPKSWSSAYVTGCTSASAWVSDLQARAAQWLSLHTPILTLSSAKFPIWLGGLAMPDAFLAASKQAAALV